MELRIATTILFTSLGLFGLFVVSRVLPAGELNCSSRDTGDSWMVETSLSSPRNEDTAPEQSIAQFLQVKLEIGHLSRNQDFEASDHLAGLDHSSRALVIELARSLRSRSAVAAAGGGADQQQQKPEQEEAWGLLSFNYGVARVVKRLVVCSAYRTSLREFTVITLSPDFTIFTANPDFRNLPPKDPAVRRTCTWLADGDAGAPFFASALAMNETGRATDALGEVEFRWIGETHGTSYDVLLIHCTFPEAVGTDLSGGYLYLNITHGSGPSAPTELAPVFRELPESLKPSIFENPRQFRFEFAYCSAPVFTILTPNHVKEFLMYHHALLEGSVHFFIYDSQGIDANTMAVLQPLIDAGSLTVVNFRKESEYDTWYHSQDLAINDCVYRSRDLARWVLSWDMDEYLHVRPPLTLAAVLEDHKDAPWISFGKIDFAPSHCAPSKSNDAMAPAEWAVERMLFRQESPICGALCNGDRGARKWMANPRQIRAGRIHAVADWSKGVVLSTDVARINHYRGLVAPRGRFSCHEIRDPLAADSTTDLDGKTLLWSDSELAIYVSSTLKSAVEALPMFRGGGGGEPEMMNGK